MVPLTLLCLSTGVCLAWSAANRTVSLVHTVSGAAITLSPTGHLSYSPTAQPVDVFLDACSELAQHREKEQQLDHEQHSSLEQQDQDQQQQQHILAPIMEQDPPVLQQGHQHAVPDGNSELLEDQHSQTSVDDNDHQEDRLTLQEVCSLPDCWGLLGLDLLTGEAVLYEDGSCKLHVAPGRTMVMLSRLSRFGCCGLL